MSKIESMTCPLCKLEADEGDLINPYWQAAALKLAHSMNPDWNESEGCCARCFDKILDTIETAWVPTDDYPIRGLKDGYRYVLSTRQTGQWHHQNRDLQRWHQNRIAKDAADQATAVGFVEWFIFDSTETVLAQGRVMDT